MLSKGQKINERYEEEVSSDSGDDKDEDLNV